MHLCTRIAVRVRRGENAVLTEVPANPNEIDAFVEFAELAKTQVARSNDLNG